MFPLMNDPTGDSIWRMEPSGPGVHPRSVVWSALFLMMSPTTRLWTLVLVCALAIPAIAIHLHNTYFTVAHLHVALVGVIGGAVFGGLFHFWPQWWQCILPAKSVRISAYTMLVGICLTFLPMVALGTLGLPRSLYEYPDNYRVLHAISSVGSFLLVASLLHAIAILALSARRRIPAIEGPQPIGGEFTYSHMNFQIEER